MTYADDGFTWRPWVRALSPHDVALIARDLETINDHDVEAGLGRSYSSGQALDSEVAYATAFLYKARGCVHAAASDGRRFAYMIG